MKLIFEFARIAAFCFAGEVCHLVLPLPIPASVYGLMLLLAALRFGVVKLEQVRTAALFLTGIFPLLFVPAAAGVMAGVMASLFSVLALALLLDLNHEQYITLLPKSVTTAISMDVSRELGGIATLTGAIVILTGIVGALAAETVCKVFRITNPIAKGIGIGTASHAVGTSKALEIGEVEGAMSGLSVAVAGIMTAVLCPLFSELIH